MVSYRNQDLYKNSKNDDVVSKVVKCWSIWKQSRFQRLIVIE